MSANPYRGEIIAEMDGREWTLCLTLGALGELERAFGASDLSDLAQKLSGGNLTAAQLTALIASGLRGGGHDVSNADVAEMRFDAGATSMAQIAAQLLTATFAPTGSAPAESADQASSGEVAPNPARPQDR